ncbi:MAG: prolipoprotein diacylglyceryl transferase [Neisseriaceae bacterium]|nr:prolipoprotein diacylglyceryl transferase [Neisseriaceae bacterium]
MLVHPDISPIAIQIGPLAVHWYGLMYLFGFMVFLSLGRVLIQRNKTRLTRDDLDDLLFFGILGVILGGRLGYVLFYKPSFYWENPLSAFKIWEGGMAFHGGLLGVIVALFLFARQKQYGFLEIVDFVAPLVPFGLAAGRVGNFINGELWGRVTNPNAFWAMTFPKTAQDADLSFLQTHPEWLNIYLQFGALPRHPSQLYQCALEGLSLLVILWTLANKKQPLAQGQLASLFLLGYGLARFIVEYAREPDSYLGFINAFGLALSMGQCLSFPMILLGLFGFIYFGHSSKSLAQIKPS